MTTTSEQVDGLVELAAHAMRLMYEHNGPEFNGTSAGEKLQAAVTLAVAVQEPLDLVDAVSTQVVPGGTDTIEVHNEDEPLGIPTVRRLGFAKPGASD